MEDYMGSIMDDNSSGSDEESVSKSKKKSQIEVEYEDAINQPTSMLH